MTVAEAIEKLKTYPQDAVLIITYCSDYQEVTDKDFTFMDGTRNYEATGSGLVRHHGHLMEINKRWMESGWWEEHRHGEKPEPTNFVMAVHIG